MKFGDGRWVVQGTLQPESIPVRIVLEKNGDLVTAFPLGEF